jgi:hypothetical protein
LKLVDHGCNFPLLRCYRLITLPPYYVKRAYHPLHCF